MAGKAGDMGFGLWVGKIPWKRKWQFTPICLSGKPHEERRLVDHSPWGRKESDMTEHAHTHTHTHTKYLGHGVFIFSTRIFSYKHSVSATYFTPEKQI